MKVPVFVRPLLVLASLFLGACDTAPHSPGDTPKSDNARVTTAPAAPLAFGERFSLTGTVTAQRQARLSARTDGLVSRVHVDAGDQVEAGQTLLELDSALAHQALLRARANATEATAAVREAQRLVTEAQRLAAHNAIATTELGARTAALELARAAEQSAHASVREQEEIVTRHVLPAPFSGVVAEKLSEIGEWVQRGTPVLSLVATHPVYLDLRVPQERFEQIGDDIQARVFSDALGGRPLEARIGAKVPVTNPDARTFLLRLLVDDPQGGLLPGTSARAEISLSQTAGDAVLISRDALLRQPDGSHSIYVVQDERGQIVARRRVVRVLHDEGSGVAVASDHIKVGERIIIRGNEALRDGQRVDVVEH